MTTSYRTCWPVTPRTPCWRHGWTGTNQGKERGEGAGRWRDERREGAGRWRDERREGAGRWRDERREGAGRWRDERREGGRTVKGWEEGGGRTVKGWEEGGGRTVKGWEEGGGRTVKGWEEGGAGRWRDERREGAGRWRDEEKGRDKRERVRLSMLVLIFFRQILPLQGWRSKTPEAIGNTKYWSSKKQKKMKPDYFSLPLSICVFSKATVAAVFSGVWTTNEFCSGG